MIKNRKQLTKFKNIVLDAFELYNLKNDYLEQSNPLAEYPDKVADLKAKYTTWRSEIGKPMGGDTKKRKSKQPSISII